MRIDRSILREGSGGPMREYAIGFAEKYYTLWLITREAGRTEMGTEYEDISGRYIRNLSMSLDDAMAKAPGARVDTELKGTSDWRVSGRSEAERLDEERRLADMASRGLFPDGKYRRTPIAECGDIGYMKWYINFGCRGGKANTIAKGLVLDRLSELGCEIVKVSEGDIRIYTPDEVGMLDDERRAAAAARRMMADARAGVPVEVECLSNLDDRGYVKTLGEPFGHGFPPGEWYGVRFEDYKTMEYQGIAYALPMLKGRGVRIKGKTVRADACRVEGGGKWGDNGTTLVITSFTVLPGGETK